MKIKFTKTVGFAALLTCVATGGVLTSAHAAETAGNTVGASMSSGISSAAKAGADEGMTQLNAMRLRAAQHPWEKVAGTLSPDKILRAVFIDSNGNHDIYIVHEGSKGYVHFSGKMFDAPNLQARFWRADDNVHWVVDIISAPAPQAAPATATDVDSDGTTMTAASRTTPASATQPARVVARVEFQPQYYDLKFADGHLERHESFGSGCGVHSLANKPAGTLSPTTPNLLLSPNPNGSFAYYYGSDKGFPMASQGSDTPEMFEPSTLMFGGNGMGAGFSGGAGIQAPK